MGHSHTHPHSHGHSHSHGDHTHTHAAIEASDATNMDIPDSELRPSELGRRNFLRAAGLLGAGAVTASLVTAEGIATAQTAHAAAAPTATPPANGYTWLAGDHHIHTQFSPDGLYRVEDQVKHADAFGLDWVVITDHGGSQHVKIGADKVRPHIVESRSLHPNMFVFQGLEWNIPAAEHGTVFVHPGSNEVYVLKSFEANFDGGVTGTSANSPENEAHAIKGLQSLRGRVDSALVKDAIMLANHPARQGIDSPHEVRGWRDNGKGIAIGWEGAPGHQAAGISTAKMGPGSGRGYYAGAPKAGSSFPGYPLESYRTWGGFDFYTATVGGLWDSLLAEGKPWWITANSDSHSNYLDTAVRGAGSDFNTNGFYNDPEYSGIPNTGAGDYYPGFYSRTNVGVTNRSYADIMSAMRAGNVWVDHGRLLESVDFKVRVIEKGTGVEQVTGLGGTIVAPQGSEVIVSARILPAQRSNWAQFRPKLAKVDLIQGLVTGPAADKDTMTAPQTKVFRSWDVTGQPIVQIEQSVGVVDGMGMYVRMRGSDGKRTQPGYMGAAVDPAGPAIDVLGDADPWQDLWFYTNPVFVLPKA